VLVGGVHFFTTINRCMRPTAGPMFCRAWVGEDLPPMQPNSTTFTTTLREHVPPPPPPPPPHTYTQLTWATCSPATPETSRATTGELTQPGRADGTLAVELPLMHAQQAPASKPAHHHARTHVHRALENMNLVPPRPLSRFYGEADAALHAAGMPQSVVPALQRSRPFTFLHDEGVWHLPERYNEVRRMRAGPEGAPHAGGTGGCAPCGRGRRVRRMRAGPEGAPHAGGASARCCCGEAGPWAGAAAVGPALRQRLRGRFRQFCVKGGRLGHTERWGMFDMRLRLCQS
jgi:hypothetical protein